MASDDGITPTSIPHLRFALVLIMAKFFDGFTSYFVLSYAEDIYEPGWVANAVMQATDPYIGTILITLFTVFSLTAFAITIDMGRNYLPKITGRDAFCYWGSLSVYIVGTGYYSYTAVQNLSLLV